MRQSRKLLLRTGKNWPSERTGDASVKHQDRDRLKVLHEVKGEHITQRVAAQQLGISGRWVRTLPGRVKQEGDRGVVHRLRGRVSNRRLPEKVRTKALEPRRSNENLLTVR